MMMIRVNVTNVTGGRFSLLFVEVLADSEQTRLNL